MAITKRVSYAITTFSGPEPIKLWTTENKVKELTNKWLGTHEFPQCLGIIDDPHVKLNEHYSDYINRRDCFSLNVQAACDCKYCFIKVVRKWPGSVHDFLIFSDSSANKMLWKGTIPPSEKTMIDSSFPIWWLCISFWSHLSWRSFQVVAMFKRIVFSYEWSNARITSQLRIHLVHWKPVLDACNVLWMLI